MIPIGFSQLRNQITGRKSRLNAVTGDVNSAQNHLYDKTTNQELLPKSGRESGPVFL